MRSRTVQDRARGRVIRVGITKAAKARWRARSRRQKARHRVRTRGTPDLPWVVPAGPGVRAGWRWRRMAPDAGTRQVMVPATEGEASSARSRRRVPLLADVHD